MPRATKPSRGRTRPVRYAVVGLGHIAQVAILPAFAHAGNSTLAALVSDSPKKRSELGRRYDIPVRVGYDGFDALMRSGDIDAAFIALPNSMHRDFAVRAANAGVHVLCEKPMAATSADCRAMLAACRRRDARLMIAYRLHFDVANLRVVEHVRSGALGPVRIFSSTFTMRVQDADNIRLRSDLGGGPLFDIGIYCINAARMIYRAEPTEVYAVATRAGRRMCDVLPTVSATLRYPGERVASFVCSFAAADTSAYDVIGERGRVRLEHAYDYAKPRELEIVTPKKSQRLTFAPRDQFAAELVYFSRCVQRKREPEPDGTEGAADVAIVEALHRSIARGRPVAVRGPSPATHASPRQRIDRPATRRRETVHVTSPRGS